MPTFRSPRDPDFRLIGVDSRPTNDVFYRFIALGAGRRWERFGPVLVNRPAPAAEAGSGSEGGWDIQQAATSSQATAYYMAHALGSPDRAEWQIMQALPDPWQIVWPLDLLARRGAAPLKFELQLTPAGQVGIFPEQGMQWNWLVEQMDGRAAADGEPLKILNLFAYTGGSTLALAAAAQAFARRVEIVHLDAARNVVQWARRNAELSQLADAPIRWIVEDARKFVEREAKRGNRYDAIVLDPPSYGHGPDGQAWKIDRDLPPLLRACGELLSNCPAFLLLTCHSPDHGERELRRLLQTNGCAPRERIIETGAMELASERGDRLPAGYFARWNSMER